MLLRALALAAPLAMITARADALDTGPGEAGKAGSRAACLPLPPG